MVRWAAEIPGARRGLLALADGRCFAGWVVGERPAFGEVVFNTSMFGYQEMLTDPSYRGQILVLTTPHVGVVGTNRDDPESQRVWASALVVQDLEVHPSNWRSQEDLVRFAETAGTALGFGFDTRAVVLHLRQFGSLPGVLAPTTDPEEAKTLARQARSTDGLDLTPEVSCQRPAPWTEAPWGQVRPAPSVRVGVLDFGVKASILRRLVAAGAEVRLFPGRTSARKLLASGLDGLVVSNGPGDPAAVKGAMQLLEKLLGRLPILGICLGHQLLALALGGRTYKLKFGHHGANHPVQVLSSGEVWITSQNHNYTVDAASLPSGVAVTMVNLTDGSVEGIAAEDLRATGVQFHPEAGPGPHDALSVFGDFVARCRAAGERR